MTALSIDLHWQRTTAELKPGGYANAHEVIFNDQHSITVDAAPDWGGDPANTNPEQTLAAALSSCHMMTFLALAAKAGWPVRNYRDHTTATLGKNERGQMSVTRVVLEPSVTFDEGFAIDSEDMERMQQRAHRYCFIANTLASSVEVEVKVPEQVHD